MSPDKTVEERIGILETREVDCQKQQEERYMGLMNRVERLENKLIGALGIGVVLMLGIVANIILTLIKK